MSSTEWTTVTSRRRLTFLAKSMKSSKYWSKRDSFPERGAAVPSSARWAKAVGKNSRSSTSFWVVRSRAA